MQFLYERNPFGFESTASQFHAPHHPSLRAGHKLSQNGVPLCRPKTLKWFRISAVSDVNGERGGERLVEGQEWQEKGIQLPRGQEAQVRLHKSYISRQGRGRESELNVANRLQGDPSDWLTLNCDVPP